MQLKRFGDRLQLKLESGEKVTQSLTALLRGDDIGYAALVGLGSLRDVRLSYWNAVSQEYETHSFEEQLEVVSLVGNATRRDGEPALHLHVSLGRRDLSLIGGHFNDGVVHPTLELWLTREEGVVERRLDEACGLPLMALPETLG